MPVVVGDGELLQPLNHVAPQAMGQVGSDFGSQSAFEDTDD
jgi:hypothetical protein